MMARQDMVEKNNMADQEWDFIVVGGGATGVGRSVEVISRDYKVLLREGNGFSPGTSSRSIQLIL